MSGLRLIAAFLGFGLAWLALISIQLAETGTCTQGDDGMFAVSFVLGVFFGVPALILLWLGRKAPPMTGLLGVFHLPLIYFNVPVLWMRLKRSTFGGSDLCDASSRAGLFTVWWAPFELVLMLVLVMAMGSYWLPRPDRSG
jgi:hypothetical protein